LRQQLDEWRQPLEADSAVEEAVLRMLRSIDRHLERRREPGDARA
jgi:hypothetical protein